MKIAIVVPMPEEAEFYRHYFHAGVEKQFGATVFTHFRVGKNDIFLGLSGIGKVNAAMNLASLLTAEKINLIFMTGSAGSLQADIHRKDLILVNSFAYYDAHNTKAGNYVEGQIPREPARYVLASPQREQFAAYLKKSSIAFREGLVVTGDSFISSAAQKEAIKKNFPEALGCEMEGAAFAQVAYHFQTPLVALRAISDNGDRKASADFSQFVQEVGAKAAKLICGYIEKMN